MSNSIISVRNLHKTYRMGKVEVEALRGVNLEVPAGEFLTIVGPSGSGKSTLFHIVGGLTPPSSGEVIVNGMNVATCGDAGRTALRRGGVAFVFQKFNLLPNLSARDNIKMALYIGGQSTENVDERLSNILEMLGIAGRLDHRPSEMSGGEMQRVAIARALATHPAILLADEPTGNLDSKNSVAVLELLKSLNEKMGQTILMITHDTEAAGWGHRTVHMADGQIVETTRA